MVKKGLERRNKGRRTTQHAVLHFVVNLQLVYFCCYNMEAAKSSIAPLFRQTFLPTSTDAQWKVAYPPELIDRDYYMLKQKLRAFSLITDNFCQIPSFHRPKALFYMEVQSMNCNCLASSNRLFLSLPTGPGKLRYSTAKSSYLVLDYTTVSQDSK